MSVSSAVMPSGEVGLVVVVPMLNERAGAEACVSRIIAALASLDRPGRLVVVDDGSTDGTGDLLDELEAANEDLSVVRHPFNRGYGAALRTGVARADRLGAEWVLFMDSDLTNPPQDIVRFVEAIDEGVEYVKASRYVEGGSVQGVPFKRRLISRLGNAFAGRLFGLPLSDLTNGFRAIRTSTFLAMPLHESAFPMIMEEAYWASRWNLRCRELPTVLTNRDGALRKSSFRYGPGILYAYGRYPVKAFVARRRSASRSRT